MRPLKIALCAGAMALASYGVSASTLGLVEFKTFINGASPFNADLATADIALNQFNGADSLPGGLPLGYVVHLNRTFDGDGDSATADLFDDSYVFKLDPAAQSPGGQRLVADLSLVDGLDNGVRNVSFALFEADPTTGAQGDVIGGIRGPGHFEALLDGTTHYLLKVIGNLHADVASTLGIDESSNFGQYNVVFGAFGVVVPIPPAILLFLTGIAALFGFSGLRRNGKAESSAQTA